MERENRIKTEIGSVLEQAFVHLESCEFSAAEQCLDRVLAAEPENGVAYLGKLMVSLRVPTEARLADCPYPFDANAYYRKTVRYADAALSARLQRYLTAIRTRSAGSDAEAAYLGAIEAFNTACSEEDYLAAAKLFDAISAYRDSAEKAQKCRKMADLQRNDTAYASACALMEQAAGETRERQYALLVKASALFAEISDWKDAAKRLELCGAQIARYEKAVQREEEEEEEQKSRWSRRLRAILIAAILFISVTSITILMLPVTTHLILPELNYSAGASARNAGNYVEAVAYFEKAKNYKNSKAMVRTCWFEYGKQLMQMERYDEAIIAFEKAGDYGYQKMIFNCIALKTDALQNKDPRQAMTMYLQAADDAFDNNVRLLLDSYPYHAKVCFGYDSNVYILCKNDRILSPGASEYNWGKVISLAGNRKCGSFGLKSDGTVVGESGYESCQKTIVNWQDLIAIAAGDEHLLGLTTYGKLYAWGSNTKGQCNVSQWDHIVAVAAGTYHTVGLKSDGTVIATGSNESRQTEVSAWKDVIQVAAGNQHTVALKKDGTVVATGNNNLGQCNVSKWKDVVQVAAGSDYTAALCADGSILFTGSHGILDWQNITSLTVGSSSHIGATIIGITSDGRVIADSDDINEMEYTVK